MKFAVIMTCHNREGMTIECLRGLYECKLHRGKTFDVWLNDDGCTDGTAAKVSLLFPSVNVIMGSGHDYWCGGMRRAWGAASKYFDYDGYVWLNDDTFLNEFRIQILCRNDEDIFSNCIAKAYRDLGLTASLVDYGKVYADKMIVDALEHR